MRKNESYEVITLYRGKDSATYLAEDFEKYGEDAVPLFVRQNPLENIPFVKIQLQDTDAVEKSTFVSKPPYTKGSWDIEAIKRLQQGDK